VAQAAIGPATAAKGYGLGVRTSCSRKNPAVIGFPGATVAVWQTSSTGSGLREGQLEMRHMRRAVVLLRCAELDQGRYPVGREATLNRRRQSVVTVPPLSNFYRFSNCPCDWSIGAAF
jgi:hypothetical protein